MSVSEFHEGQIVYLEPMNHKRIAGYTEMQTGVVVLVGRKFITVEINNWPYRFDIKTFKQVVKPGELRDWRIFFSKKDYDNHVQWDKLYDFFKEKLAARETCRISLEQMMAIYEVIRNLDEDSEVTR